MFEILNLYRFQHLSRLCLLTILFTWHAAQAGLPADPRNINVKDGHPILFADEKSVEKARDNTKALNKFVDSAKQKYIKANNHDIPLIKKDVAERTKTGQHEGYYVNHIGIPYGLHALLTQDPISIEYCRQFLLSFIDMGVDWHGPGDGYSTGKLFAMGLFYDWIHEHLSPDTRRQIREHLLDSIDFLDTSENGRSLMNPGSYTGGHAHYTHIYALVALLAIRHDIELDSTARQDQYFRLFGKVVNHWVKGYNPVNEWTSEGGGHNMGWSYSQAYTRSLPYLAWESATNEDSWFTDWQVDRTFYYLYAMRQLQPSQYNMFPVIGDGAAFNWNPALSGLETTIAASLFNNSYAAWLAGQLGISDFAQLLYASDKWPAATPPSNLPLARHFPNSGYVVMRDSWNSNQNTLMTFKSSSFYSFNHHHRDENSFTIFYKAPLAIDSGTYLAGRNYGSEHWYNYYTRSIAHNTLLVYDSNEIFRGLEGAIISNDGGQKVMNNITPTLKQMTGGGEYHLDGIVSYENHADYTYSVGDATKAYAASKLSQFKRSVIYLRNHSYDHPLILIHDRVISTKPELKKTYLLHAINKPLVNDTTVEISISALPAPMTGLHQETILPQKPLIRIIGGRENQQEFFVQNNGFGKPHNYNDDVPYGDKANVIVRRSLLEAGEWRVEISPTEPATDDTFLHAISIVDVPRMNPRSITQYVKSDNIDGVLIQDADGKEKTLVLFQRDPGNLQAKISLPKNFPFERILIIGLNPQSTYSIEKSDSTLFVRNEFSGGFFSSDAGTLYTDTLSINTTPAVDSTDSPASAGL